ncbi:MAG: hypothetical protein ACXU7H_05575 [Burkholderiaceae bacterium]
MIQVSVSEEWDAGFKQTGIVMHVWRASAARECPHNARLRRIRPGVLAMAHIDGQKWQEDCAGSASAACADSGNGGNFSHEWGEFLYRNVTPFSVTWLLIDNQKECVMNPHRSRIYTKRHVVAERLAEIFLACILIFWVGVLVFH